MSAISSKAIETAVRERADRIVEWAGKLIALPSENRPPDGAEEKAQAFIEGELRELGLELDVFSPEEAPGAPEHPWWLAGRRYGTKRRNVVGRWRGSGNGRSLLLSSHADVAPFEPDDWKICRPYEPLVKDGRLYGRGSADMKGGLAATFWAVRILRELGFEPAGDILVESVVDEEFAGGNGALAARLRGHNADLAIVPEPTQMEVCPACLGAVLGDLTVRGTPGMPYTGHAIPTPIRGAARAVELFSQWEQQWRDENSHPLFNGPGKELKLLLWRISSETAGEFTQMGTPLFTTVSWVVWCYPGTSEEEIRRRLQGYWQAVSDPALAPFELEIEPAYHFVRPWETPATDPAVQTVEECFRRQAHREPVVAGAPFSCDLAIYGEIGQMPAFLLGPRGENLHAPDEYVEIDDVLALTRTFAELAVTWCGRARS